MTTTRDPAGDLLAFARALAASESDPGIRSAAEAVAARLAGPLRVAIAGRVKAGKSTLLNALVGERLAPTDAGECTRVVTIYRHAAGYDVEAVRTDGQAVPLQFTRSNGSLDIQLGELDERDVRTIEVGWPSSALRTITIIDTPGLASLDEDNSRRTHEFLEHDADRTHEADAVIYLLRHAHRADLAFLDAFMDRSVGAASPVNAIAVLSRADEVGGGRPDAMESARRIATRCEADTQLRGLCSVVVPLAGLLAETALTLREDEAAALRVLATTDDATLTKMLRSADAFCELSSSVVTVESRRSLLARLGLFGVRVAVADVRSGRVSSASELSGALLAHSGLPGLQRVLAAQFGPRARTLQACSALASLRTLVRRIRLADPVRANSLEQQLEQIEAGAAQFARVRAEHLVGTGAAQLDPGEAADLRGLLSAMPPSGKLGLPPTATADEMTARVLAGVGRWRTRAADPLTDPITGEVCEVAVRVLEEIYVDLTTAG